MTAIVAVLKGRERHVIPVLALAALVPVFSSRIAANPATALHSIDSAQTRALAKTLERLSMGSTLRVRYRDGALVEGAWTPGTRPVLLRSGTGEAVILKLEAVDTLWERRISKWKGRVIGGALGGSIGAVALTSALLRLSDSICEFSSGCTESNDSGPIFVGVVVGGLAGGGIGAFVGGASTSGSPVWVERYPHDQR